MKAMLLAAGESLRLPEARRYGSKLLIPVKGRAILERNLIFLKRAGFRKIIINLCCGKDQLLAFLKRKKFFGLDLSFSVEQEPLGTAGGVKKARKFFSGEDFLVLYGDNLCDFDISTLWKVHRQKKAIGTLGVFHPRKTNHSGIFAGLIKVESDGRISKFLEKRNNRKIDEQNYVNAGIAIFSPGIFRWIPTGQICDFGRDIYPRLLGKKARFFAAEGATYVLASDTPEALKKTRQLAAKIL